MAEQQLPAKGSLNQPLAFGEGPYVSYQVLTTTGILSSLRSFAQFLGLMPQDTLKDRHLEEFEAFKSPGLISVQIFCDKLSLLYMSPDTQGIDMSRWMVTHLRIIKNENGPQHESVLAKLKCNLGNTPEVELRIERTKEIPSNGLVASSKYSVDKLVQTSGQSSGEHKYSVDMVSYSKSTRLMLNSECLSEPYPLPSEYPFYLPQLIVLACSVSAQNDYHLVKSNCYWFAGTMVAMAQAYVNRAAAGFTTIDQEKTIKGKVKANNGRQVEVGTWHGVSMCSSKEIENNINPLLTKFDKQWAAFTTKIKQVVDVTQNPEYQAMEQTAKQERLQKEEEMRKRKEVEEELKELREALARQHYHIGNA